MNPPKYWRYLTPSLFLPVLILLQPGTMAACSCGTPAVCYGYGEAAAVFVGRVTEIIPWKPHPIPSVEPNANGGFAANRASRRPNSPQIDPNLMQNRIRFAVDEVYAGESQPEIEIQTHSQSTACGFQFVQGESYLVYAYRTSKSGPLVTSSCDRTAPIVDATEDLSFLRSLPHKGSGGNLEITLSELQPDPHPMIPLAGIRVQVSSITDSTEAITDSKGRAVLEALPTGIYQVKAFLPESLVEAYPPREIQVNDGGCSRYSFFAQVKDQHPKKPAETP